MQNNFIVGCLRLRRRSCRCYHTVGDTSGSSVISSIKWVRDRALDHAVEKEKDLKPMINIKDLINSEPSKSLPLSIISDKRSSLGIPIRPIDFIRKYPSVFLEFLPGNIGIHPHIKLTPEILALNAQEKLLFESQNQIKDVADRLVKLLMLARINKIPLSVIDRLKWDLGLPNDYTQTIVPQFPDYFQVTSNGNELELVCWSDELAVSVMEKNKMSSFPVQYSRGFEPDKKFKKWIDDWQKLPYISPYENATSLMAKSDESDKWIVSLLHEVFHLLVPKKTEKDNLLFFGEFLGVRSRFKRALLQHPGIFYISNKLHTHTVVLREGYKRDLLASKPIHPLMTLRSSYIHLMNMVIEKTKSKNAEAVRAKKENTAKDSNEGDDGEWDEGMSEEDEEDDDETDCSLSGSEIEDVTDNNSNDDQTPIKKEKFEGRVSLKRGRIETGDHDTRGKSREIEFKDLHRRNTPNRWGSENDGRRRGQGRSRKNPYTGINEMADKRGARETNRLPFLKTEDPNARKARGRTSRRLIISSTREG